MDRLFLASQTCVSKENHQENQMILGENSIVGIKTAEYLGEYRLRLQFTDNRERMVDFGPFLASSTNPMTKKYLILRNSKNSLLNMEI